MFTRIAIAAVAVIAMTLPADANGKAKKRIVSEREIVRVYEPRPAPPEPLLQLSILGTGLIISDDLDIDLFDVEERRRQHFRGREFDRRRFSRERHRGRR